jgi:hypothetical protein
MNYRRIGRTGWRVSDISFRAWAIAGNWGQVLERDALAALNKAVESGALDDHRNFNRHGESFDCRRNVLEELTTRSPWRELKIFAGLARPGFHDANSLCGGS